MLDKLFLSVGAMKAGTTWLHHQLADHPMIYFTPEKEIHFFADPDGSNGPMQPSQRIERFKRVMRNVQPDGLNDRVRRNIAWYGKQYLQDKVSKDWYIDLFAPHKQGQYCSDFSNLYCLMNKSQWEQVRQTAKKILSLIHI